MSIALKGKLQRLKASVSKSLTPALDQKDAYFIEYSMEIGEEVLLLNNLLGKTFEFTFSGNIFCQYCGNKTKKSFQNGYCYPCAMSLARCDICSVRPEKCHFHLGTCREPEWGEAHCLIPHIVYLANTSNLKVGMTRERNIPTRWIDQGATEALPMARVFSRLQAGLVESSLAKCVPDKTHWRVMLKGESSTIDLLQNYHKLREKYLESEGSLNQNDINIQWLNENVKEFKYPILRYLDKIQSINPEKEAQFSSPLLGIKGQYLIFEKGVLNVRNLAGYELELRVN